MPDGETKKTESRANLGFDAKLWLATELLCFNLDETEYEHVVLGLISLTYISDPFDEHHARLVERGEATPGPIPRARTNTSPPKSFPTALAKRHDVHDIFAIQSTPRQLPPIRHPRHPAAKTAER